VPLLDAVRALTSFTPPPALPECDPALLGDVLEAHGLAPMASYQLEHGRLGGTAPEALRERLLTSYQGVVNDNFQKLVALRTLLRDLEGLTVVFLEATAYVDWLYPHVAFRPVGEPRLAVAGPDGARFIDGVAGVSVLRTEHEGRTAVLTDGKLTFTMQEGLWPGGPEDRALFERSQPYRLFGPSARRPSSEDALLGTVAEQALLGLHAPLLTFIDLRELLALPLDLEYLRARADGLGLSRALHGATLLVAHFFPESADTAARLRPPLGLAERLAVERVVESAKDPARLRHVRGADQAARLVVAP